MINTTIAYKRAINGNRVFRVRDKITFKNQAPLQLSINDFMSYSINDATSNSGKFDIGAAVMKEYSAVLNNETGKFDGYVFEEADLQAIVGLEVEENAWEDLNKGSFRVVSAKKDELTITIKAYDYMLFFDRPYSESTLTYPATVSQIIADACRHCQMAYDASTIEMGSYIVQERPKADALTFRDVISYCAQIMGSFARVNRLDKLCFGWYKISSIPENIDGGNFDKISGNTYVDVDPSWDGGSFDDYASGDEYDGSSFVATDYYHHLFNLRSQTINADDIRITGIKVTAKSESSQTAESVMKGTDGYVLEVSGNPLIQTGAVEAVAAYVYAKLGNMVFRPLSISGQSDPSIEAGDVAMVTDRKNRTYNTVITNNTFVLCGDQKVECSAETPTEKNYTRFGPGTKLMSKAKEQTDGQLSAYDIAVQNMNQLAANTFGFYATTVKQADGSILAYRHDKPKLAESKIVYKSGIDGFWVTSDYQGNDADTTWKAGFDSSGDAVMNVLSVIGINFSWAHGGVLTLGGNGNGNGKLVINNSAGKQIGYIDNTGVHFNQGEFSGSLKAATGTFAGKLTAPTGNIGGWKISNNPQCIYSGDSPGSTGITLYADGRIVADFPGASDEESGARFSVSRSGIETHNIILTDVNIDTGTITNAEIEEAIIGSGTIAGWKISNDPQCIYSGTSPGSTDGITLYASGSITFGGVGLGRSGQAVTVKYGLHIYNGDETQFSDGSEQFKIFNTAKSTSTATLVMHNQTVYRSSSSSKRYKNHIREVSEEDVQKLFDIPVVYFEYKDGYLSVNDPKVGIPIPGFYAEDMEQAFPDAVLYEDGKVEDWNYRALIPAMEKQIQILCKQSQELIEAIKQLKEDVSHGN